MIGNITIVILGAYNTYNAKSQNCNNYNEEVKNSSGMNLKNEHNYSGQVQSHVNNKVNNELDEKLKKQQKRLEKKLKRKMQDAYLKAYGDYLSENGYRVKYRVDWRKVPQAILIIIVLIIIGWIIWILPVTHNYLVEFYEENIIIQKIVSIFF